MIILKKCYNLQSKHHNEHRSKKIQFRRRYQNLIQVIKMKYREQEFVMRVMTYDMIKCIFVDEYAADPDKINTV